VWPLAELTDAIGVARVHQLQREIGQCLDVARERRLGTARVDPGVLQRLQQPESGYAGQIGIDDDVAQTEGAVVDACDGCEIERGSRLREARRKVGEALRAAAGKKLVGGDAVEIRMYEVGQLPFDPTGQGARHGRVIQGNFAQRAQHVDQRVALDGCNRLAEGSNDDALTRGGVVCNEYGPEATLA
jgi:hypothetical protein